MAVEGTSKKKTTCKTEQGVNFKISALQKKSGGAQRLNYPLKQSNSVSTIGCKL